MGLDLPGRRMARSEMVWPHEREESQAERSGESQCESVKSVKAEF